MLEERCGPGEEGRWSGFTALQMAAKSGNREVAEQLIAHGADFDIFSAVALGDKGRIHQLLDRDETE